MVDREALLIRYQVLAANRRHFDALFFAVIAFTSGFGLAVWVAAKWAYPTHIAAGFAAAGAIFMCGALIAHRLLKRERSSFDAMQACWREISETPAASSGVSSALFPGAMSVAVAAQFAAGAMLLACAIVQIY